MSRTNTEKEMPNNFQKDLKEDSSQIKTESQLPTTEGSTTKQGRCKMKSKG